MTLILFWDGIQISLLIFSLALSGQVTRFICPSNTHWKIDKSGTELGRLGRGCLTECMGVHFRHNHSRLWSGSYRSRSGKILFKFTIGKAVDPVVPLQYSGGFKWFCINCRPVLQWRSLPSFKGWVVSYYYSLCYYIGSTCVCFSVSFTWSFD